MQNLLVDHLRLGRNILSDGYFFKVRTLIINLTTIRLLMRSLTFPRVKEYLQFNEPRYLEVELMLLVNTLHQHTPHISHKGPEYTISASYCYPLSGSIMFGPTIGIVYQNQAPVAAVGVSNNNNVPQYLYGPFAPPGEDSPVLPGSKRIIVGNFGGSVKISLSGRDRPALLILDYATQTGVGAGQRFRSDKLMHFRRLIRNIF